VFEEVSLEITVLKLNTGPEVAVWTWVLHASLHFVSVSGTILIQVT